MREQDRTATVSLTLSPEPEIRYVSALTVYTERFADGELAGVQWSANGHIEDAKRFAAFGVDVPAASFRIVLDGQSLENGWRFAAAEADAGRAWIDLEHTLRPVRIRVRTESDGTGFLQRWIELANTGTHTAALSGFDVFAGVLLSGASLGAAGFQRTPFSLGRFTGNNWSQEGRFAWEPLANGIATGLYAAGPYGTSGFHSPFFLIRDEHTPRHFAFYLGWSGPWRADVTCDTTLRRMLHVRVGPDAPAPMRLVEPGETIVSPRVHIGYLLGDLDACVQAAHEHIRRSVMPRSPHMPRPLVTHNSAGSLGLDGLGEAEMRADIELASSLGAEAYMVDAGWYGTGPASRREKAPYPRFMGDWVPGEWFPNGLGPLVNLVKERGMRFGLWIEPEAVGLESDTYRRHPEWVVTRKGRPLAHVAERLNLDFANPEVRAWLESELVRVVTEYGVDIIRFDGAPMSAFIGERVEHGYLENTAWRHYEFLYGVMERLAARFPRLLIENCCGGGGRLDLGILSRSHRTQVSDEARPPRSVQILNGVSLMLPPEYTMIFPFLPGWQSETADLDSLFRIVLFGGMYILGWTRRMQDQHPGFLKTARRYVDLYKAVVAPLLPGCRVFHHTPVVVLEGAEPTPSCVLEYAADDGRAAMVGVFKLTDAPEPVVVYPRGLDPAATYRVRFDNDGADGLASGLSLRREGVRVSLPRPLSSELLLFTRE